MTAERWIEAAWPFVEAHVPPPPARILEVGCGSEGGFVPLLERMGHEAVGVDPRAPESGSYHRMEIERFSAVRPFDAVVASLSLHHVADLDGVLDRLSAMLSAGGAIVVVEWAWEQMDEATARWCFERLPEDGEPSWLRRRRDDWEASGQPWGAYLEAWSSHERLHASRRIVDGLDRRFERITLEAGPYFFTSLAIGEAEEAEAIAAGRIRAVGRRYAGRLVSAAAGGPSAPAGAG